MFAKTKVVPHFSKYVRTDKPHISNSYLSTLKRALLGQDQFYGSEHHLVFGTEHHRRSLEPGEPRAVLQRDEQLCSDMSLSFTSNPEVKKILKGAKTEVQYDVIYRGLHVQVRIDIDRPRDWFDLKGTKCTDERDFIRKAREYDYFRQAALYEACVGTPGTFIGESKIPIACEYNQPGSVFDGFKYVYHPLFWLRAHDYPNYLDEGYRELHALMDIHRALRSHYER